MIDELALFVRGVVVGFSVSAPVGPIGIMCIRRTLSHGPRWGLAVGLGAASADLIYSAAAAFGLSLIAEYLVPWSIPLRFLAAAIIGWLAVRAVRASRVELADLPAQSLAATYGTSFALVISNPGAIAIFTGVFVGLGLTSVDEWGAGVAIVSGVVCGAVGWWVLLTSGLTLLRARIDEQWLLRVNLASGIALGLIATIVLVTTVIALGGA